MLISPQSAISNHQLSDTTFIKRTLLFCDPEGTLSIFHTTHPEKATQLLLFLCCQLSTRIIDFSLHPYV